MAYIDERKKYYGDQNSAANAYEGYSGARHMIFNGAAPEVSLQIAPKSIAELDYANRVEEQKRLAALDWYRSLPPETFSTQSSIPFLGLDETGRNQWYNEQMANASGWSGYADVNQARGQAAANAAELQYWTDLANQRASRFEGYTQEDYDGEVTRLEDRLSRAYSWQANYFTGRSDADQSGYNERISRLQEQLAQAKQDAEDFRAWNAGQETVRSQQAEAAAGQAAINAARNQPIYGAASDPAALLTDRTGIDAAAGLTAQEESPEESEAAALARWNTAAMQYMNDPVVMMAIAQGQDPMSIIQSAPESTEMGQANRDLAAARENARAERAAQRARRQEVIADVQAAMGGSATDRIHYYQTDDSWRTPSDNWTDAQRETYEYLMSTDPDLAEQFAIDTNNARNAVENQYQQNETAAWGAEHPWMAAGRSLLTSATFGGLESVGDKWIEQNVRGQSTTHPNASRSELASAGVQGAATKLTEQYGVLPEGIPVIGGKGVGDLYQIGLSIAQSKIAELENTFIPGGAAFSAMMFFGDAADSAYNSPHMQGQPEENKFVYATLCGLTELVTEELGIERLTTMDTSTGKAAIFNILIGQPMAEGGEEAVASVADMIWDMLINGDRAELAQAVEEKGSQQAISEWVEGVAFDFLGGYISGFASGGMETAGRAVKQTVDRNSAYSQTGHAIIDSGGQAQLVEDAKAIGDDKLTKLAGKVSKDPGNSRIRQAINANRTGRLFFDVVEARQNANNNNQQNNVDNSTPTHAENAEDVDNNTPTTNIPDKLNVSDDGRQYVTNEEGNTVAAETSRVTSVENGQVTFELANGQTVDSGKISFRNAGEAAMVNAIAQMQVTPDMANHLLSRVEQVGDTTGGFAQGNLEYYAMGAAGQPMATYGNVDTQYGNLLTELDRQTAYTLGRQVYDQRIANAAKAQPKLAATQRANAEEFAGRVVNGVKYDSSIPADYNFTDLQKPVVEFLEAAAQAGANVYLFQSKPGDKIQGRYVGKDGSIHIDIAAGNSRNGVMAYTVAHEFTHFAEEHDAEGFKAFADALFEATGTDVQSAIREKLRSSGRNTEGMSQEELDKWAFSEVVAEACETMLSNTDASQKVVEKLRQKNPSFVQKVADFFRDLAKRLRKAYEKMMPDSNIARSTMEQIQNSEKLAELWSSTVANAIENYQKAEETTGEISPNAEGVEVDANGEPVAYSSGDGSVMLSIRTYEESGKDAFDKFLNKAVDSKKLTKTEADDMRRSIDEIYRICKDFKDKYAPFSAWSDAEVIRDTRGRPVFSVVTPNGDYKMNLDFSLVCKKRRTLDAVFNEMSRRGIIDNFDLGQKSVVKINEIIRSYGFETACALCFVDAKRFRQAQMADMFTSLYNDLVKSLAPDADSKDFAHFNFAGYSTIQDVSNGVDTWNDSDLDFSHLREVMQNYGKGTVEHKAAKYIMEHPEGRKLLLRGDFMSSAGFDAVKSRNKDILSLYNSKKGTGGPKAAFGDVQYLNEVLQKARTWTPAKAYAVGGVRIQSFSDYVPRMVFDYVQMIHDLAANKLPAHAYSKEAAFVKQFGLTGAKINMSLIPAVDVNGVAPGLDANGNYKWAGESFDYDTAIEIQKAPGYSENCGTIAVGVSREHILKLLADPNIRMVIPYHKSGLNPIVAHMNRIAAFTDYTLVQNTRDGNGSRVSKDFDFNKALHDQGNNGDPKAVAKQYLEWCEENGYTPKFDEFADDPNYYKLLEDFTLYDEDGNYVPQREVRAVFPDENSAFGSMRELIEAGLEEDAIVEGNRDRNLGKIVDEIERSLPRSEADIAETEVQQAETDLEAVGERSLNSERYSYDYLPSDAFYKDSRIYDYDFLVAQPDMTVVRSLPALSELKNEFGDIDKKIVTDAGIKNVIKNGGQFIEKTSSYALKNVYTGRNLMISKNSIEHGLGNNNISTLRTNARLGAVIGDLCKNAIPINGMQNEHNVLGTYAMVAVTETQFDGRQTPMVALITVQQNTNSVQSVEYVDVVHAVSGRPNNKISERRSAQGTATDISADRPTRLSDRISISDLLEIVNDTHQGFLSDDVIEKLGSERRGEKKGLFSTRTTPTVQTEAEAQRADLSVYEKEFARLVRAYEAQTGRDDRTIKRLREKLDAEAKGHKADNVTWNREFNRLLKEYQAEGEDIDALTKKLEKQRAETDAYKQKLKDTRQKMRQESRERVEKITENYKASRKKALDGRRRTEARHKVIKIVDKLNKLLLSGDKDHHVPSQLQGAVAAALDVVNFDTVNAQERIEAAQKRLAEAKTDKERAEISKTIYRLMEMGDRIDQKLRDLADAYAKIQQSDNKSAYDGVIAEKILDTIEVVGQTPIREMSVDQLNAVYQMYKAVLGRIQSANKAFATAKAARISDLVESVEGELAEKPDRPKTESAGGKAVDRFIRNNDKPIYAFDRIGSDTLTELYRNMRRGEDVWVTDINEATEFFRSQAKKFDYNSWDKERTWEFESSTGKKFRLNLEQIMSLYAYSRREQAADHIRKGGIVIDQTTEVTVKGILGLKKTVTIDDATAYKISDQTLEEIISKLTAPQKSFAIAMQDYLSSVMGAKGNEVSMQLYDIELFGEKNYFPLVSSRDFMARAKEQSENPNNKIKNAGMTKAVIRHASNPVVLTGFMETWARHVDQMSLYHGMTLPMEDFYRVYNWNNGTSEDSDTHSMQELLINKVGRGSVEYIDQLLKDLNGGVRADSRETFAKSMISRFKKAAVFTSASVIIQQPSAIGRAFAIIDPKYFGALKDYNGLSQSQAWEQLKRYAPIAAIKEMGMFDTDVSKSTVDYITSTEYEGWKEKAKAMVFDADYRDEVLGKAPAKADEITWTKIWDACKRKVAAEQKLTGEELLKAAGELFTETIERTQVYDSVFSRSANMRSKSGLMAMTTAFMAEPTTNINMLMEGVRQIQNGDKKKGVRNIASVAAAAVINSLLVSFVYAARDDDEDKAFIEKYAANFVTGLMDALNPMNMMPYLRDVWSMAMGYDIERTDMSILGEIIDAVNAVSKIMFKDTSKMDDEELDAYYRSMRNAGMKLVDSIFSFFGLSEKNIRREVNAVINLFQRSNWQDVSMQTLWNSIWNDVRNNIPIARNAPHDSKEDQLYNAYVSGDTVWRSRAEGGYADQKAIDNALRSGLRNNDTRIRLAAQALLAGDTQERVRITKEIIAEGIFSQDIIVTAINAEANSMKETEGNGYNPKATSIYNADDYARAAAAGTRGLADMKNDLIKSYVANGKSAAKAESSFRSAAIGAVRDLYDDGTFNRATAIKALVNGGFYNSDDAGKKVDEWAFANQYGFNWSERNEEYLAGNISRNDLRSGMIRLGKTQEEADNAIARLDFIKAAPQASDISESAAVRYNSYVASTGVSRMAFYQAWMETRSMKKKTELTQYIANLNIPDNQKAALWKALSPNNWKTNGYPWGDKRYN